MGQNGKKIFGRVIYASETIQNCKNPTGHIDTLKLIENRNSCAHLQLFCCVVPREENEHCRSSTDFIDELLQLKPLQMRRNKKAGILKSLLEKFLPDRFRKPRTARICKPS